MWGLSSYAVTDRLDLVAEPVATAVADARYAVAVREARVAPIDPRLADTADFAESYGVPLRASANCVVVRAKRGGRAWNAACVVLATTRADVNGAARRHLEARKASFASQEEAVRESGMEYGGITPIGLPIEWQILVDSAVVDEPWVVVGGGLRASKIVLPGAALAELPSVYVLSALAQATG